MHMCEVWHSVMNKVNKYKQESYRLLIIINNERQLWMKHTYWKMNNSYMYLQWHICRQSRIEYNTITIILCLGTHDISFDTQNVFSIIDYMLILNSI